MKVDLQVCSAEYQIPVYGCAGRARWHNVDGRQPCASASGSIWRAAQASAILATQPDVAQESEPTPVSFFVLRWRTADMYETAASTKTLMTATEHETLSGGFACAQNFEVREKFPNRRFPNSACGFLMLHTKCAKHVKHQSELSNPHNCGIRGRRGARTHPEHTVVEQQIKSMMQCIE